MQTANRLHGGDSFTVHLLIREHQTKSVEGKDEGITSDVYSLYDSRCK